MKELERFDPLSWLDEGVLVMGDGDESGQSPARERRNVSFKLRQAFGVVSLSSAVGVSLVHVATPSPVFSCARIAPGITKEERGDPDLVNPSYWREVGDVMASMPSLPEEDASVADPELVDLNT